MTKKDILNKIKRTILGEDTTPGITTTKKVQKTEKQFSDDYYKETDKKFKDYLGIKKDTFDTPKVNADEKQEKTYGGSGMEGLTYDNEGTEVEKKFKKRNDNLNKPSKDYYLKKDEIDDTYSKLKNKAKDYQEDKKKFQNTKPVRAIKAENTMKRLTYKKEFLSENAALSLIPEEFKKDDLVFEMTDGNKLMRVRWEGGTNGKAVVLISKDKEKINKELDRMHKLFEYNSRENFGKSNLLTEEQEFESMVKTLRGTVEEADVTDPSKDVEKKLAEPKPINIEVRQEGNKFNAGKYVQGKSVPVPPGIMATYEKYSDTTYLWEINFDKTISKEDLVGAVKNILDEKPFGVDRVRTDLESYINANKNKLGLDKYSALKDLIS